MIPDDAPQQRHMTERMGRLISLGCGLFALGLAGLGITHFTFQEFTTGRAPAWPEGLPGGTAWAYVTGSVILATSLAILTGRLARPATLVTATLVCLWALTRHLQVIADSPFLSGAWTDAGKALRFVGGALAVAAMPPQRRGQGPKPPAGERWYAEAGLLLAARIAIGPTFVLNGIQHFTSTRFVAALIPEWFPGDAVLWTHLTGVALIMGGLGLLIPRTATLAAILSGLMVFPWFFIIHVTRESAGVADDIAVYEALVTAGMLFVLAGAPSGRTAPALSQSGPLVTPDPDTTPPAPAPGRAA